MFKSIKFRMYPNKAQTEALENQLGAARFVYNWALDYSTWEYRHNGTITFKNDWGALLPKIKEWFPWLKDSNAQCLQQELRHLECAYKRFFNKHRSYPKFKNKRSPQSITIPQGFVIKEGLLSIPKIKNIPIAESKDLSGMNLRFVTVKKTRSGKFFVIVLYETGIDPPAAPAPIRAASVGIDLGLTHFAILSTGEKICNPRFLEKGSKRLKRLQRSWSRKKPDSANRSRAHRRLVLLHERIANQRANFIHHHTHRLTYESQGVDTICVEDLNVAGMLKNTALAPSILSVGWGQFLRQLKYKCLWNGKNLLKCGRFAPTSKLCSVCGSKNEKLRLAERAWICPGCGSKHDRDINAAKNIIDFAFSAYSEDTEDLKPVEREALVGSQSKLPSETAVYEAGSAFTERVLSKDI